MCVLLMRFDSNRQCLYGEYHEINSFYAHRFISPQFLYLCKDYEDLLIKWNCLFNVSDERECIANQINQSNAFKLQNFVKIPITFEYNQWKMFNCIHKILIRISVQLILIDFSAHFSTFCWKLDLFDFSFSLFFWAICFVCSVRLNAYYLVVLRFRAIQWIGLLH